MQSASCFPRQAACAGKPSVINVIIADHQPIYRAGVAKLLASEDDMRIIAQPLSTAHLFNAVDKLRPHVVVLSSGFLSKHSEVQKFAATAGERRIAILMLTDHSEESPNFVPFGVQGVFYRSVKTDMLVEGVRRLASGGRYMQIHAAAEISTDLVGERVASKLTRRELQIVAAVVRGYRNREIAEQLGSPEPLIKRAIRAIYDKTGVSGRLELALFVVHHQVLAQAAATEHASRSWPSFPMIKASARRRRSGIFPPQIGTFSPLGPKPA